MINRFVSKQNRQVVCMCECENDKEKNADGEGEDREIGCKK